MFFVLSKLLFYLVMPVTLILVAIFIAVFSKKPRLKRKSLVATLILLLFFTNPFLSNEAMVLWEVPPTPVNEVGQYDAAIILTGISDQEKSPHDRMYTTRGADRVLHPLMLYRMGKVKSFIITGGSGSLRQTYSSESAEIKRLLIAAGVPDSLILTEEKSRNTRENAVHTASILQQHPEFKKLLLVTSAFHMRRASGCFKKAGVQADTFAADFYTSDRSFAFNRFIMPSEHALYVWQKLVHEILGYTVYRLVGYL